MSTTPDLEYVQGGADFGAIERKTKAALKKAIKEDPHSIWLYDTTAVGPSKFMGPADRLPAGIEFMVVGPDPYTKRDWYASVYRNKRGGLTVK